MKEIKSFTVVHSTPKLVTLFRRYFCYADSAAKRYTLSLILDPGLHRKSVQMHYLQQVWCRAVNTLYPA